MDFLDLLTVHAGRTPDALCVAFEDQALSFADVNRYSASLATWLKMRGIGQGDRVSILSPTSPLFYELVFACARIGAIMNPLNWRLASREIGEIIADAAPKLILVDPEMRPLAGSPAHSCQVIELGLAFEADYRSTSAEAERSIDDPEAPLLLLYTSGTTGIPKGVVLSHRNIALNGRTAAEAWSFSSRSCNLVAMPLFHVGGMGYGMMALSQGGATVLLRQADPVSIAAAIHRHSATHAFFVPSVIQRLIEHIERNALSVESMRLVAYGAAPISETLLARAVSVLGCDFAHAYGMTETGGTVITLLPADHDPASSYPGRLLSCGQALPWVEAMIADPATGGRVEQGMVGELRIRSPMVMKGYWQRPAATDAAITPDGWLCTGDAASLDADGYVYLRGRYKDMIVSGGENIYPAEIENVLARHSEVAEVAVVGVPHELWGETPRAFVSRREGAACSAGDLIAFAREHLAHYKCPTSIVFLETLPKNASGKVLKHALGGEGPVSLALSGNG